MVGPCSRRSGMATEMSRSRNPLFLCLAGIAGVADQLPLVFWFHQYYTTY